MMALRIKKRKRIYFLFLFETITNERIRMTKPGITFEPFIPPLFIQIIEIPIWAIIIIGILIGSIIRLNLTK